MKGFVIPLVGVISVILLAGSVQSVAADHLEQAGQGIFKGKYEVNFVPDRDSNYQVHLLVEIRNAQNQLVSISEALSGYYIPHEISDHTFDEKLGIKEIVTIDNIKYEKGKFSGKPPMEKLIPEYHRPAHFIGNWVLNLCAEFKGHGYVCIPVFQANTAFMAIAEDDIVINHWTILRVMN